MNPAAPPRRLAAVPEIWPHPPPLLRARCSASRRPQAHAIHGNTPPPGSPTVSCTSPPPCCWPLPIAQGHHWLLAAGIAIRGLGTGAGEQRAGTSALCQFGVVLMLFLVGRAQPSRHRPAPPIFFGTGTAQVLARRRAVCAGRAGKPARAREPGGCAGTGVVVHRRLRWVLAERNLMRARQPGRFSILLFRDVAASHLALLPCWAQPRIEGAGHTPGEMVLEVLKIVGVIAAIILGGRLLLRRAAALDRQKQTEIFTAAALLLVVGITPYLMVLVGLSMALGALFLTSDAAGRREYRRELETDIEPFKGTAAGAVLHRRGHEHRLRCHLARRPHGRHLVGFLATGQGRSSTPWPRWSIPLPGRPSLLLAQGGGVCVVSVRAAAGPACSRRDRLALCRRCRCDPRCCRFLLDRVLLRRYIKLKAEPQTEKSPEPQKRHIIIARASAALRSRSSRACCWPRASHHRAGPQRGHAGDIAHTFGYRVFYGDATRPRPVAHSPGPNTRIPQWWPWTMPSSPLQIAKLAREHFHLQIVARARDVTTGTSCATWA